jgi:hypothetical protein
MFYFLSDTTSFINKTLENRGFASKFMFTVRKLFKEKWIFDIAKDWICS